MIFQSKRNSVRLVDGKVEKLFHEADACERELLTISELKKQGVAAPNLLSREGLCLVYEFVDGVVYAELADCMTREPARALSDWLCAYYKTICALKNDVNLRNFIYTPEGICVGLDFEDELLRGDIEDDFGKIIAFTSTYEPLFSEAKQESCKNLITEFLRVGANLELLEVCYLREIDAMSKRRHEPKITTERAAAFWASLKLDDGVK